MNKFFALIKAEPVRFAAALQAVIALGTAFGLSLSGQQVGAIMAAEGAIVLFFVRGAVTPA